MAKPKVACLLAGDFEDSELKVPYDRLTGAGIQVDIIGGRAGEQLEGKRHEETALTDKSIDGVRPEDYDALLIPGGYSPDKLRADERFVEFVRRFDRLGKPIAAVCHGPQLLLTAGLVKGRAMTGWKTVQADLKAAGADVRDEPLVLDRNWITSRKPEDLGVFTEALLKSLR
ncbi:MAG: type 1 glutamine amidotransferase [Myxococcales bacterium]|nr:type 1 glutamine amidotransferase [Myxococcales bacterium]